MQALRGFPGIAVEELVPIDASRRETTLTRTGYLYTDCVDASNNLRVRFIDARTLQTGDFHCHKRRSDHSANICVWLSNANRQSQFRGETLPPETVQHLSTSLVLLFMFVL